VGAVIHTASVKPGETVAVVGCGGVGLSVIQGAVLAGAARIIAIDRSAEALRYAAELGASDVIDASAVDPLEALQELLGDGVDHAFEAIGNKVTVELSWRLVRRGGTVTVLGLLPADLKIELDASGFGDEKKIQGCSMGSQRFRSDVPYYLEMYRQGRLKLDELILRTYDFHDIGTALSDLKRGAPGRGVVMFPAADAATTAPAKG
jgi:S-(hydroxymethyl)glutathione dehydrogenase/alcohol dehydrogenase